MTKATLVTNPRSGGADSAGIDDLLRILHRGFEVEVVDFPSKDSLKSDLPRAALHSDLVIVVGGDGSLNLALNALVESLDDIALGIIPTGTGNDLARTLGLPLHPPKAAGALVDGIEKELDVGMASGRGAEMLFANACMGGFPVEVDEAITEEQKARFGAAAFWLGGFKAAAELRRWEVAVDGSGVSDTVAVGVGNGRTCGGGIEVWPSADPSDGLLDSCTLPAATVLEALRVAAKVRSGKHLELDGVIYKQDSEITIGATPNIEFNVDGELVGLRSPVTFSSHRKVRFRSPSEHD